MLLLLWENGVALTKETTSFFPPPPHPGGLMALSSFHWQDDIPKGRLGGLPPSMGHLA